MSRPEDIRVSPAVRLDLQRVGGERIVEIDGKPGLFTPFVGADPGDVKSTDNLQKVVDTLRGQVGQLQAENAELTARVAELSAVSRSSDDVASALQHSLDVLQAKLSTMENPLTNFAVREFQLESKVHVDVTALGTVGFRFVGQGEQVQVGELSTLTINLVPVPKPVSDDEEPAPTPKLVPLEAIDGLSADQARALRAAHVADAASFAQIATRATATATLVSMLGVNRDTLGRFVLLAGLLAVPGLDRQKAAVLYDAGIRDAARLASVTPTTLVRVYTKAAKARADDDAFRPTKEEAAAWIQAARALTTG